MKSNKKIFSWINEKLEIKETIQCGKGVFACSPIKKDTPLIVFGGYIFTRKEEQQLPSEISDVAMQIEKDLVIGILDKKDLANSDYVNHSCNPSAGIKGQISLVAMRDIKSGEEITFDYGTVIFKGKGAPKYELQCLCGSKDCRGKITQFDWKREEIQKKYKGYFPYYIQEEIDNLKKKHV